MKTSSKSLCAFQLLCGLHIVHKMPTMDGICLPTHMHAFLMKKTQVTKQNQWYMLGEKKHSYFLHCGRGNAMCLLNYSPTIRNDHVTESWPRECGQKRYMPPPGLAHWTFYAQPLCPLFLGPPWVPPMKTTGINMYICLCTYMHIFI